jgi:hypothetical protein
MLWFRCMSGAGMVCAGHEPSHLVPVAVVVAIPMLLGHRAVMRQRNLYDTSATPRSSSHGSASPRDSAPRLQLQRSQSAVDGMAGARFGRNVPIEATFGETEPELIPIRA